jgi:hypothetical protein
MGEMHVLPTDRVHDAEEIPAIVEDEQGAVLVDRVAVVDGGSKCRTPPPSTWARRTVLGWPRLNGTVMIATPPDFRTLSISRSAASYEKTCSSTSKLTT